MATSFSPCRRFAVCTLAGHQKLEHAIHGLGITSMVTVGVVTHERSDLFANMLEHLRETIRVCPYPVSVLVVNNSGTSTHDAVAQLLKGSDLASLCAVRLVDSPENNISIGRNLILDLSETNLVAFIDDDEYPRVDWLTKLVDLFEHRDCDMVGGPIMPVYPETTPRWVQHIDLHNVRGMKTGDVIRRTATGNCLVSRDAIGEYRFDPAFGLSGGGDAHFFETLARCGKTLMWCSEAIVDETITEKRGAARYAIFRFIKQGNNFSRFMLIDVGLAGRCWFRARAAGLAFVGIVGGAVLLPVNPRLCAHWWKGGFTNLGKVVRLRSSLYGD